MKSHFFHLTHFNLSSLRLSSKVQGSPHEIRDQASPEAEVSVLSGDDSESPLSKLVFLFFLPLAHEKTDVNAFCVLFITLMYILASFKNACQEQNYLFHAFWL